MNSEVGSNNPKLQSVNYVTILPEGKTSGYKPGQQVDFKIDPIQFPYIDGKQSYLLLNVTPTGTFSNVNATADVPLMFPPNQGANSLVNRLVCRVNDGTGKIIEDREGYNLYNGIRNSYTNDTDVFPALAKVEGVTGRSTALVNRSISNVNNTYFYPKPDISTTVGTALSGNKLQQNSFVVPIQLGLFSGFGDQHMAVPNMDIGGCHLTYHLETANRTLQTLTHEFLRLESINGSDVVACNPKGLIDELAGDWVSTTQFEISTDECDCSLLLNEKPFTIDMCAFRVGMPIKSVNKGLGVSMVTQVEIDGDNIRVTVANAIGVVGTDTITADEISSRSYTIDKIELRVLNTMPDMPTMKSMKKAVQRGINFNSTQLYKLSTASQLKNAVLDIPESLTKCLSIYAVPCQQNDLDSTDLSNSYVFPRPDSALPGNTNNYNYQWQVKQVLIPNLQVDTNVVTDTKNDNVIFFNQQIMAQRPMYPVRSLDDGALSCMSDNSDLNLPFFFPLLLAPMGQSFDLIDAAPQLRVENTESTDTTSKLYFVFINHVRMLQGNSMGGIDVTF